MKLRPCRRPGCPRHATGWRLRYPFRCRNPHRAQWVAVCSDHGPADLWLAA